jgi:hypothetical protein
LRTECLKDDKKGNTEYWVPFYHERQGFLNEMRESVYRVTCEEKTSFYIHSHYIYAHHRHDGDGCLYL